MKERMDKLHATMEQDEKFRQDLFSLETPEELQEFYKNRVFLFVQRK